MMKVLGLLMNRYLIIAFAVVAVGLRLLSEYYDFPESYSSFFETIKPILFLIYIVATFIVLSFIVAALVTKSKSGSWWETLKNPPKESKKEKLLQVYIQSLIISFVIVAYGTIIYLALTGTWTTIFIMAVMVIAGNLITYFQAHKRQRDFPKE